MKLQFKVQSYQTAAVEALADCFDGQPRSDVRSYLLDPGRIATGQQYRASDLMDGFANAALDLSAERILANVKTVQRRQNLPQSQSLTDYFDGQATSKDGTPKRRPSSYKPGADFNFDIEMETGTGKTYCYIKSIFELNRRYGWSKFIVMVPSVAIREGVRTAFHATQDHFAQAYNGKKARAFVYNSKSLDQLESFSSDAGINVMIINIQAFNARGKDNRRIYEELDDFQSRKPIDVIKANRPVLILDEPQKMGGEATLKALPEFNPLFILRYSASHAVTHAKIYRLDALDAYNQKLVKKIAVRGIQTRGLAGTNAYLYLQRVEISRSDPVAWIELEVKRANGEIKRTLRKVTKSDNLYEISNNLEQYRDRFTIAEISAQNGEDQVAFTNGQVLRGGQASGDVHEADIRRIQIKEAIQAHLETEQSKFAQGIKVLSLFFIDEVVKYRDYARTDTKGDYARIFEEAYEEAVAALLATLPLEHGYRTYLQSLSAAETHQGYFSIDKKTQQLVDPRVTVRGERAGHSDDVSAYDLILKDKESLLCYPSNQDDPQSRKRKNVRFIFSHSALREGWDNPNVFVIAMLKNSESTISRRQEVGRGLRISVNQDGERNDDPATVHDINVLTVVASESYEEFVAGLQKEVDEGLSARPRKASPAFFQGKVIQTEGGPISISQAQAKQMYRYLVKNDYSDDSDEIAAAYHAAKDEGRLAPLPEELQPYASGVFNLIDSLFSAQGLAKQFESGRGKKRLLPNDNLHKKAFLDLWNRINKRAIYRVEFDSDELVGKCITALNKELRVTRLQYLVRTGSQGDKLSEQLLHEGSGFQTEKTRTHEGSALPSQVPYDLLGNLAGRVDLTRRTVAKILAGLVPGVYEQFSTNPEHFLAEAARLIKEQKGTQVIEQLSYDETERLYDVDIFTKDQTSQDFSKATERLKKHVYDYCITDSQTEKKFVQALDDADDVVVYAKIPKGFQIPTPVGDYNPDWAIAFQKGRVRHIYFVAETKGSLSSIQFRKLEEIKIKCAKKYFERITDLSDANRVKYGVVDSYSSLMDLVS